MIILASASPRRQELLRLIFSDFVIEPSDIDESVNEDLELKKYPEYLAVKKAEYIYKSNHQNDLVIGCDTGVFIDNLMLGKPKDKSDAKSMLKLLSGRKHDVITGCAVYNQGQCRSFSVTTEVEFYPLSDKEIEQYILTGEPMDKAGAYGIQGEGALFVKGIVGDYYNVVGLPISALNQVISNGL